MDKNHEKIDYVVQWVNNKNDITSLLMIILALLSLLYFGITQNICGIIITMVSISFIIICLSLAKKVRNRYWIGIIFRIIIFFSVFIILVIYANTWTLIDGKKLNQALWVLSFFILFV